MKKALFILLALALLAPAFADDAKVLPAGVFRTSFVFARNAYDQAYDADGDLIPNPGVGAVSALTLGAAIEFGITDQITGALQWTPAYVISSSFENNPYGTGELNANGFMDLFVGAKLQILGAKGFIQNETFRLAFAPGVLIPIPDNTDWLAEAAKIGGAEDIKIASPSDQAIGLGFRAYFDYVISKMFFVNLYNQTIFYLPVNLTSLSSPVTEEEYKYGYKLTFEVEPHFDYSFSDKVSVSAGVPLTLTMKPESTVDGATLDPASHILTVSPSASIFVMAFIPFELKAGYTLPLLGQNTSAASTLVLQLKTFLKF